MPEESRAERFQRVLLPHLPAAYNLARWLARNNSDADDLVQEAYLRALNFFDGFRGGDGKSWLLTIVRNTYYSWMRRNRAGAQAVEFDEAIHAIDPYSATPESALLEKTDRLELIAALEKLPDEFREALVLREMEGLTYHQIAELAGIPLGTVMSRLARGRQKLLEILSTRPAARGAK